MLVLHHPKLLFPLHDMVSPIPQQAIAPSRLHGIPGRVSLLTHLGGLSSRNSGPVLFL